MRKASKGLAVVLLAASIWALPGDSSAHGRRDCLPPCPPQTVILTVCHPCTGCRHDIPVCIPGCVVGVPCASFDRTLIGAGRTIFEWQGGYRVIVRYQKDGGYRVVQRD